MYYKGYGSSSFRNGEIKASKGTEIIVRLGRYLGVSDLRWPGLVNDIISGNNFMRAWEAADYIPFPNPM